MNHDRFLRKTVLPGMSAIAVTVFALACGTDNGKLQTEPTTEVSQTQVRVEPDPLVSSVGFGYGKEPTNVQGIVNRVDAIVVARVTSFDGVRDEGPYVNGVLTEPPTPVTGEPSMGMKQGYFSFEIEEVLLDDGYVTDATNIRGSADEHHRFNPDVDERYILSLFRNPDNRSYGAWPSFGLIELSNSGTATRQDGSPFRFDAPTDEESLISTFNDSIEVRREVSLNEWNEPYADLPITE